MHEVDIGEMYYEKGNVGKAMEHFANAMIFCDYPTEALSVLQQRLPADFFEMIIWQMEEKAGRGLIQFYDDSAEFDAVDKLD